jgi:hypothetical protein
MDERETALRPTRRNMLAGIGLGMIGTMAGGARAQVSSRLSPRPAPAPARTDLANADSATWSRFVGQDFAFPAIGGAVLRLIAVEAAPSGGRRPARMRSHFHAIFEAVGRTVPEGDATYVLAPPSVAPLPLFLASREVINGRHRLVATFG